MKFLKAPTIVALVVFVVGCVSVEPGLKVEVYDGANPWTHLNLYNNPANFQFAIVADRTSGHRPGVFADGVKKLNLLRPEFVMSIGDLIEGSTEDEVEVNQQWDEFDSMVNELQMPFFYVPGNHDIGNEVMAEKWNKRFGPSYYHFVYRDVLFLCINTEENFTDWREPGHISDQQVEYFRKVINANNNVRWTLVFMHRPFWMGKSENLEKLESLLSDRPYTVFAGHKHIYDRTVRKGRQYYTLSTTGGAVWDSEQEECQLDHIVWVTMTDDGPMIANLLLDGILDDEPCLQ